MAVSLVALSSQRRPRAPSPASDHCNVTAAPNTAESRRHRFEQREPVAHGDRSQARKGFRASLSMPSRRRFPTTSRRRTQARADRDPQQSRSMPSARPATTPSSPGLQSSSAGVPPRRREGGAVVEPRLAGQAEARRHFDQYRRPPASPASTGSWGRSAPASTSDAPGEAEHEVGERGQRSAMVATIAKELAARARASSRRAAWCPRPIPWRRATRDELGRVLDERRVPFAGIGIDQPEAGGPDHHADDRMNGAGLAGHARHDVARRVDRHEHQRRPPRAVA